MNPNPGVSARELFDDYRYYRTHTAHFQRIRKERPYMRDLKETPERIALFDSMMKWCAARALPPRQWLYSLFAVRHWLFAPKLEVSCLLSENHVQKFKGITDYALYSQRQREREFLSFSGWDPNRDISPGVEELKRAYLYRNDAAACLNKMESETFGFHPRSTVCVRCPMKEPCQHILESKCKFDIIGLRSGTITSDQARSQALQRTQSYGR